MGTRELAVCRAYHFLEVLEEGEAVVEVCFVSEVQ